MESVTDMLRYVQEKEVINVCLLSKPTVSKVIFIVITRHTAQLIYLA